MPFNGFVFEHARAREREIWKNQRIPDLIHLQYSRDSYKQGNGKVLLRINIANIYIYTYVRSHIAFIACNLGARVFICAYVNTL